jgi:hypothetical protein
MGNACESVKLKLKKSRIYRIMLSTHKQNMQETAAFFVHRQWLGASPWAGVAKGG